MPATGIERAPADGKRPLRAAQHWAASTDEARRPEAFAARAGRLESVARRRGGIAPGASLPPRTSMWALRGKYSPGPVWKCGLKEELAGHSKTAVHIPASGETSWVQEREATLLAASASMAASRFFMLY